MQACIQPNKRRVQTEQIPTVKNTEEKKTELNKKNRHVHTPADEFVRLDRAVTEEHAPFRTHPV